MRLLKWGKRLARAGGIDCPDRRKRALAAVEIRKKVLRNHKAEIEKTAEA